MGVERERPEVVVVDIRMPPTSTDEGIQAAARLREIHPDIGVVVLSQHAEPEYALKLLEKGSARRAYLLKDSLTSPDRLVSAIREVAWGGSVIDPRVVESLVAARSRHADSQMRHLTDRERDVLSKMAQGKSNDAIGISLHLSTRMVEKHITAIFSKLGFGEEPDVHRRVKAVLIYLSETGGRAGFALARRACVAFACRGGAAPGDDAGSIPDASGRPAPTGVV